MLCTTYSVQFIKNQQYHDVCILLCIEMALNGCIYLFKLVMHSAKIAFASKMALHKQLVCGGHLYVTHIYIIIDLLFIINISDVFISLERQVYYKYCPSQKGISYHVIICIELHSLIATVVSFYLVFCFLIMVKPDGCRQILVFVLYMPFIIYLFIYVQFQCSFGCFSSL